MIAGGMPTVFVTDLDRSVAFYSETLGLALTFRGGEAWAQLDAGAGLTIGLHPAGPDFLPAAGSNISIGLTVDEPIEQVVARLSGAGIVFPHGVKAEGPGLKLAEFSDPDGNPLYLAERSY